MTFTVTHWRSLTDPIGIRRTHSLATLLRIFSTPVVAESKSKLPGVTLATFARDYRAKASVELVCGIGLDIDGGASLDEVTERFEWCRGIVHSTPSSTPNEPRWRVVLILVDPVNESTARNATCAMLARAPGKVDYACKDASRLWFRPWAGAAHNIAHELPGAPLDAHEIAYDWQERTAIQGERATSTGPVRAATEYGRRALEGLLADVSQAGTGQRSRVLAACSYRLGRLVAGGVLEESSRDRMLELVAGWSDPGKTRSTVLRQFDEGAKSPIDRLARG